MFLIWAGSERSSVPHKPVAEFAITLGGKIAKLLKTEPNLLTDRTDEQVQAAMQKDLDKILRQQKAIKAGGDWRGVK